MRKPKKTRAAAPEQVPEPPLPMVTIDASAIGNALYTRVASLVDDGLGDHGNTSAIEEAVTILRLLWMVENARRTRTTKFLVELTGMHP